MQNKLSEHKTEREREMDEVTQSLTLHVENLQVSSGGVCCEGQWFGSGPDINSRPVTTVGQSPKMDGGKSFVAGVIPINHQDSLHVDITAQPHTLSRWCPSCLSRLS